MSVLTDEQRVSVINAPAGSGKTRVMTEAARVWAAAGRGPVVGITPHSPSATPWPILAGDTGQLQAVENDGAMSLLAGPLGYVRLAHPVQFRAIWEQAAGLRLRERECSGFLDHGVLVSRGLVAGGDQLVRH